MSEAVQETTVEQTSDNKSEASVEQVKKTPTDKNETTRMPDVDYLSLELFKDVRQVTFDDLEENQEILEIPEEVQNRYQSSLKEISENEIITGRIIGINEKDVLVDIGFKSEGIISRNEFDKTNLPEIGQKLEEVLLSSSCRS